MTLATAHRISRETCGQRSDAVVEITDQPNIKYLSKFIHKKTAALQKKVGTS